MILRFLRNLAFTRAGEGAPVVVRSEEYEGFTIEATPQKDPAGWRIRGVISKEIGGEHQSRTFIRADTYPDRETATDMTMTKGKRIIDEQGESLFTRSR